MTGKNKNWGKEEEAKGLRHRRLFVVPTREDPQRGGKGRSLNPWE